MTPAPPLRGEIRWALVPHALEAPFAAAEWDGLRDFDGVAEYLQTTGARALVELRIRATMRPIVLLQGWDAAQHGAYAVLRTRRLQTLSPAVRASVRAGTASDLVLLDSPSAGHERVAVIAAISRVHGTAIDSTIAGRVTDDTMRLIDERLAENLDLDLGNAVERRVEAALAELGIS